MEQSDINQGMICSITIVQHFHSEDSSDFTGCKQSDSIQFQKAFEQFTSERHKVDAQSGPLGEKKKQNVMSDTAQRVMNTIGKKNITGSKY